MKWIFLVLLISNCLAKEYVIIESNLEDFSVGETTTRSTVTLPKYKKLTLISELGKEYKLVGPGRFDLYEMKTSPINDRQYLVKLGEEVKSKGDSDYNIINLWNLVMGKGGTHCFPENELLPILRTNVLIQSDLVIRKKDSFEELAKIVFKKGDYTVTWPTTLSIEPNIPYTLSLEQQNIKTEFVFKFIPAAIATKVAGAVWMNARGCKNQLALLLTHLEKKIL